MDGEYEAWYDLAYELKMPIHACRAAHTVADFNDWTVYLERRRERDLLTVTPDHHYLAQIAAEIVRANCNDLSTIRRISVKDFLLKFVSTKRDDTPKELTPEQVKAKIDNSKRSWMSLFGGALRSKKT